MEYGRVNINWQPAGHRQITWIISHKRASWPLWQSAILDFLQRLAIAAWTTNNAPPNTVFYGCNDTFVSVAVKVDPWKLNRRLDPAGLSLGKCTVPSTTALYNYFVFEFPYNYCMFNRMKWGTGVAFFTDLIYKPTRSGANLYSDTFTEPIVCLTSRSMDDLPIPITTVSLSGSGMGYLTFSSTFMNDDFSDTLDTKDFRLGSPINLELSVDIGHHLPLRLFVEEGIVTATRDTTSSPRYDLINNHGCFVDGKVANSKFVSQDKVNRIWMTFPAMKFVTVSDQIYITFNLVVGDPKVVTENKKACSYFRDTNRWELLDSVDNTLCRCCDFTCNSPSRKKRGINDDTGGLVHTMVLGPFKVHDPSTDGLHHSSNESKAAETGFLMPPAVGALFLELAVLLLLCVGVVLYSRSKQKETDHLHLIAEQH
ncbi:zona pellucida sperm-binding protein 3-like [Hyperolius riggenbachi]|uniref:zona pellucida sperm-binding protein 3-like n=1 Tax=Hyperolius riggenbachi TaxID=752182 RepID=UPI0035A2701B